MVGVGRGLDSPVGRRRAQRQRGGAVVGEVAPRLRLVPEILGRARGARRGREVVDLLNPPGVRGGVPGAGPDWITAHVLRALAVAVAHSQGADVLAVRRMVGQRGVSMTWRRYSCLMEDGLDEVAERPNAVGAKAREDYSRAEPVSRRLRSATYWL